MRWGERGAGEFSGIGGTYFYLMSAKKFAKAVRIGSADAALIGSQFRTESELIQPVFQAFCIQAR